VTKLLILLCFAFLFCLKILRYYVKNYFNLLFLKFILIPHPKTKSKLTLSLPEAIINLKNDNTKPYKIAECLRSVFSKMIKSKYVSMVICKHNKILQSNFFVLDRRKNKKMSDTGLHLIKRFI
jgi:hypothetical protein